MTIAQLIARHDAWLDNRRTGDLTAAKHRKSASIAISNHYRAFERIRKPLLRGELEAESLNQIEASILKTLEGHDLARHNQSGRLKAMTAEARRYLTGGWLEEIACLAALEAGADEALFGQQIVWEVNHYHGENEVDVIARFGDRLAFYSCKAYSATYRGASDRTRKKLMEALHEADNLADHFGDANAFVGLIVSTDLYDELARRPKYEALYGKAQALKVDLITLDTLHWTSLVRAMGNPARSA